MKKKNKRFNNTLYALILELIFIPTLAYVSYFIYTKLTYFTFMNDNYIFNILAIAFLTILNLIVLYYIAYALNHIYKFVLEYQIVIGFLLVFITIWFKLYYSSLETTICAYQNASGCLEAIKYNKIFSIVLIFLISYNLIYIPLHIITKRKGKKIKLSL